MPLLQKDFLPKRTRLKRPRKMTTKVNTNKGIYASVASFLRKKEAVVNPVIIPIAEYGLDAYGFAKSKPIIVMDDANLLYLLGRYGVKANKIPSPFRQSE